MRFGVPAYVSVGEIPVGIMYGRTRGLYEQEFESAMDPTGAMQIDSDKILSEKIIMSSKYMHLVGNVDNIPKNMLGTINISIATEDGKTVDIVVRNAKFRGDFTANSHLVKNCSIEMNIGRNDGNGCMYVSFPEADSSGRGIGVR